MCTCENETRRLAPDGCAMPRVSRPWRTKACERKPRRGGGRGLMAGTRPHGPAVCRPQWEGHMSHWLGARASSATTRWAGGGGGCTNRSMRTPSPPSPYPPPSTLMCHASATRFVMLGAAGVGNYQLLHRSQPGRFTTYLVMWSHPSRVCMCACARAYAFVYSRACTCDLYKYAEDLAENKISLFSNVYLVRFARCAMETGWFSVSNQI